MSEKKTLKQIEDLNQKQAQLTQVLAHDIKNSLSVISMNTELIKIKPSEVDHCVEIISQAVVQLTQLVDQFRDQQGYSVEAKSSANHSPESDLSKNKSK